MSALLMIKRYHLPQISKDMESSQSEEYYRCPVCGKDGKDLRGIALHMVVVTDAGRRPCLDYTKFKTIEEFKKDVRKRVRQRSSVVSQSSTDKVLERYFNKVKYGPMFACAICHTHHQFSGVSRIDTISRLTIKEGQQKFLEADLPPHIFIQLDDMWVCRSCRTSVSSNTMPGLASRNSLHQPRSPLSSEYSQEEVDLLSLTHVFRVVHSLSQGVARHRTTTTLDLYVPLAEVLDAEKTFESERPPDEVLLKLHIRPPGEKPAVDRRRFLKGVCVLLDESPRYKPSTDDVKQDILEFWDDTLESLPFVRLEELETSWGEEENQDKTGESHFTMGSPAMDTLYSVVLPSSRKELGAGEQKCALLKNFDVKIGGVLDDPKETSSIECQRAVTITTGQWAQQRMSHVSRSGPGCRPGFVFGLLLKELTTKLLSSRGPPKKNDLPDDKEEMEDDEDDNVVELEEEEQKEYLMSKIPGTNKYLDLKREELEARRQWYGPPTVFLTLCVSVMTEDVLACFTSQSRTKDEGFQIWHINEENKLLQRRHGQDKANDTTGGKYFVHTKSVQRYDNCPHHFNCHREPLESKRARYDSCTVISPRK